MLEINLCSCVSFDVSFKVFESLKLLISPCVAPYVVKTSKTMVQLYKQKVALHPPDLYLQKSP